MPKNNRKAEPGTAGMGEIVEYGGIKYRRVKIPSVLDFDHCLHNAIANTFSPESLEKNKHKHAEIRERIMLAKKRHRLERFASAKIAANDSSKREKALPKATDEHALDAFKKLENPSHGIHAKDIKIPAWHPQGDRKDIEGEKFMNSLIGGHRILVNVTAGKVEILDNVGYLRAVEKMGLEFPPLEIIKISFPDAQMLYCFNAANLSEWEKYVLIKSMLEYTKEKSIAKWINWNPADLAQFISLGRKIEKRARKDELESFSKKNVSLEEFFK